MWRRYASRAQLRTLNFDNPIYRKTVEENDSSWNDGAAGFGDNMTRAKLSLDTDQYNPNPPRMDDDASGSVVYQPSEQMVS